MLHGGRDASATFQFVVDAMEQDRYFVAPDWRGHGLSDRAPLGYWFPDYLADLDALLDRLFGERAVPVLGHSLGGNVACIYAGIRPERVSHLISLDGFGLPDRGPEEAPAHLRRWMEAWRNLPLSPRIHGSLQDLAARLMRAHPRLGPERARFMAEHLSRPADRGFAWAVDPLHKLPFATLHRVAEWEACIRQITAPVLWLGSASTFPPSLEREPGGFARRVELARAEFHRIPETGHNLHHDAPEVVATLIEEFLARPQGG
jgi:pimeloyl-ACP methyl ester carboxylesterase